MSTLQLFDQLQRKPLTRYLLALNEELLYRPSLHRVCYFLHAIAAAPVLAYFAEQPSEQELLILMLDNEESANSEASTIESDQSLAGPSVPKTGSDDSTTELGVSFWNDLSLNFKQTLRDWARYRGIFKVAPMYAIIPSLFVAYVGILNVLSTFIRDGAIAQRTWNFRYKKIVRSYDDPRWARDFTLDVRPLLLGSAICVPPITLVIMLVMTCRSLVRALIKSDHSQILGAPCLRIAQSSKNDDYPKSFYLSPFFPVVTVTPFLFGIPTAISLYFYWHLGVDQTMGHPSYHKEFFNSFVVIQLYIYGLAACIITLFFRAYFTYYTNFLSTEYDIEIYDDVIKSQPVKGWFSDYMTFRNLNMPKTISWAELIAIEFSAASLPKSIDCVDFKDSSFFSKIKIFHEAISRKLDTHSDTLTLAAANGRSISINLSEVSPEQKLNLFQKILRRAPSIYVPDQAQVALTGTAVLKAPEYTQIWFDALKGMNITEIAGDLLPGHVLRNGQYVITGKIASGGQAVVYAALDQSGAKVVLKEFKLAVGETIGIEMESAKDFECESTTLRQLSHPGIVKWLDQFYECGRIFLVLERVDGRSLRDCIEKDGAKALDKIFNLAKQMCDILAYLHSLSPPVVHRDFTPDNLILQPNGRLKLIDFSIARHASEHVFSECAGKHSYTPPEQFRGAACPQSDIYALGATLYYLATGKDPAPISHSLLPDTLVGSSGNQALLAEIIANATQLDLNLRYESVEWIRLALQKQSSTCRVKIPIYENT